MKRLQEPRMGSETTITPSDWIWYITTNTITRSETREWVETYENVAEHLYHFLPLSGV